METLVSLDPHFIEKIENLDLKTNRDTIILYILSIYFNIENVLLPELIHSDIILLQKAGILQKEYNLISDLKIKINPFLTENKVRSVEDSKVDELRRLFKGTKKGSMGASITVKNKLERFLNTYDYTMDDIIRVTKKYIESFHGDYTFMRQLDYFIFKRDGKKNEETSLLLAWLEEEEIENESSDNKSSYGNSLL